jgi:transposase-like protein
MPRQGTVALSGGVVGGEVRMMSHGCRPVRPVPSSAFAGFRFPAEVIVLAVRWYLRYGSSYRDVDELLVECGIDVDHVGVYRVQRFASLLVDAARPCRHGVGCRWFVDETYVKVAGWWRSAHRAIDEHGQIIDVYVSRRRDLRAARRFFASALTAHGAPDEIVTDKAPALAGAIHDLVPGAFHDTAQYANNRIETEHGRLKALATTNAGPPTGRDRQCRDARSCADAEHPPRSLRTRRRSSRHRRLAAAFTEPARTI